MKKFLLIVMAIMLCSSAFCEDEDTDFIKKAADQGDAQAQFILGVAHFKGEGVPQNYAEAYFWANLSASQDSQNAKWRDKAAAKLTPAKIEEVQARCKKWSEDFEKCKALKKP